MCFFYQHSIHLRRSRSYTVPWSALHKHKDSIVPPIVDSIGVHVDSNMIADLAIAAHATIEFDANLSVNVKDETFMVLRFP